jgi:hypothetical protein
MPERGQLLGRIDARRDGKLLRRSIFSPSTDGQTAAGGERLPELRKKIRGQ